MFLFPSGLMLGGDFSIADYLIWNEIPTVVGNLVGGLTFVGLTLFATHARTGAPAPSWPRPGGGSGRSRRNGAALVTPIMPKAEAAELVVAARIRKKLTWADLAAEIDAPVVWSVAALLGQHPMTAAQADKVCALLELDGPVSESLQRQPGSGHRPGTPRRPDDLPVPGGSRRLRSGAQGVDPRGVRRRNHERHQLQHRVRAAAHPDGDRVVVTFDGKFLDYRW